MQQPKNFLKRVRGPLAYFLPLFVPGKNPGAVPRGKGIACNTQHGPDSIRIEILVLLALGIIQMNPRAVP